MNTALAHWDLGRASDVEGRTHRGGDERRDGDLFLVLRPMSEWVGDP